MGFFARIAIRDLGASYIYGDDVRREVVIMARTRWSRGWKAGAVQALWCAMTEQQRNAWRRWAQPKGVD